MENNSKVIELKVYEHSKTAILFDVLIDNVEQTIRLESHFDDGEFNGRILRGELDDERLAYWESWVDLDKEDPQQKRLYEIAKDESIKFYNKTYQ